MANALILCTQKSLDMLEKSPVVLRSAQIYQGKSLVLKDVNLEVKQGEFVYLIGKIKFAENTLWRFAFEGR